MSRATSAYHSNMEAIREQIAALQQMADEHFGHPSDSLTWGHVGDLWLVRGQLADLLAHFRCAK